MKLTHPYTDLDGLNWLRGNLHAHTTNSDGKLSPTEVADLYAEAGYDFLCLSDHDTFTEPFGHGDLLLIPAVEVSRGGPHLLSVGHGKVYDTSQPRGAIVAEVTGDGALCVLCHPNWQAAYAHWNQAALESVGPYHGIEIFNSVIDFLEGESIATDRWDQLLSKGIHVWGYANDDFHRLGHGPRGWNRVAAEREPEAIIAALKAGRFYASTGVTIEAIEVGDETFRIRSDADEVRFITRFGKALAIEPGGEAEYRFTGDETYVRAECWGGGRTAAWTQPVRVSAE